jgi:hypothetical protein
MIFMVLLAAMQDVKYVVWTVVESRIFRDHAWKRAKGNMGRYLIAKMSWSRILVTEKLQVIARAMIRRRIH